MNCAKRETGREKEREYAVMGGIIPVGSSDVLLTWKTRAGFHDHYAIVALLLPTGCLMNSLILCREFTLRVRCHKFTRIGEKISEIYGKESAHRFFSRQRRESRLFSVLANGPALV
jgi:hypothetical protein